MMEGRLFGQLVRRLVRIAIENYVSKDKLLELVSMAFDKELTFYDDK